MPVRPDHRAITHEYPSRLVCTIPAKMLQEIRYSAWKCGTVRVSRQRSVGPCTAQELYITPSGGLLIGVKFYDLPDNDTKMRLVIDTFIAERWMHKRSCSCTARLAQAPFPISTKIVRALWATHYLIIKARSKIWERHLFLSGIFHNSYFLFILAFIVFILTSLKKY